MITSVIGNERRFSRINGPYRGRLYRHGIHIMIYGQSLVNKSPIDIMHAHRFVRQIEENELSELETYPLLERLSNMDLPDCED